MKYLKLYIFIVIIFVSVLYVFFYFILFYKKEIQNKYNPNSNIIHDKYVLSPISFFNKTEFLLWNNRQKSSVENKNIKLKVWTSSLSIKNVLSLINNDSKQRVANEKSVILGRQVWTDALSNENILSFINITYEVPLSNYIVNIGAGDSCIDNKIHCDELNLYLSTLEDQSKTLLIDSRDENCKTLSKTFPKSTVLCKFITKNNLVQDMKHIPKTFDILKIDIDRNDCDLLEVILSHGYMPNVIQTEFNVLFPPPILYNWHFNGSYENLACIKMPQQVNQCSLSYLSHMLGLYKYSLLQVDGWDAWFILNQYKLPIQVPKDDQFNYEYWWWKKGFANKLMLDEILHKTSFNFLGDLEQKQLFFENNQAIQFEFLQKYINKLSLSCIKNEYFYFL